MRFYTILSLVAFAAAAGCGRDDGEPGETAGDTASGVRIADPAEIGYDPAELAWLQEGRPVELGGRRWQPVGQPLNEPADRMVRVGTFEGMLLYAHTEDQPPYPALFIPFGNDTWQPLEPETADTTAAPTPGADAAAGNRPTRRTRATTEDRGRKTDTVPPIRRLG